MNTTSDAKPFQISEYVQVIIIIMYSFIIVIAIGGNTIVCYLVYAYKRMHTVPNYFIVNLACSDIIMALFCIPFTFVANLILNYWPFGEAMCPIVLYIQVVAVFLSTYTLVAMGIDRYIVIVHPFKPRISAKQTCITIVVIWILSLLIPLPTLLKSRILYHSNTSGQCMEVWESSTDKYVYSLMLMILHYFAPLTLLLFSYLKIVYQIWVKNIDGSDRSKRKLQLAAAKRRVSIYFRIFISPLPDEIDGEKHLKLSQLMRLWYLSHRRQANAQASLRIRAVSPEPLLSTHMKYGSRHRVRPKISHLPPLDGCACAFEE